MNCRWILLPATCEAGAAIKAWRPQLRGQSGKPPSLLEKDEAVERPNTPESAPDWTCL